METPFANEREQWRAFAGSLVRQTIVFPRALSNALISGGGGGGGGGGGALSPPYRSLAIDPGPLVMSLVGVVARSPS